MEPADRPRTIPIRPAPVRQEAPDGCSGAESYALMVLGDSMLPEFAEGDVIIIEPEGHATDGAFVLANPGGEWTFRKLVADGGAWRLDALDPRYPSVPLADLSSVRGVVIQKSRPGSRKSTVRYGE